MFDPYADFVTTVLPNGLTIHALHLPNRPQSFSAFVHNGGKHDPDGKEGLAHFVEHMITKNAPLEYHELRDYFLDFGGDINSGTTSFFATWFGFKLPAKTDIVAGGLSLFGRMMLSGQLVNNVERERAVILGEYRKSNPVEELTYIDMRARHIMYPHHWYSRVRSPLGSIASIEGFTQQDLQAFYDRCYVPANMEVVTTGGLMQEEILLLINRSPFNLSKAGIRNEDIPVPVAFGPLVQTFDRVNISEFVKGRNASMFHSTGKIPITVSKNSVKVFSDILDEVLNVEVRQKRAWTYSIGTRLNKMDSFHEFEINCPSLALEASGGIRSVVSKCIELAASNFELFEKMRRRGTTKFLVADPSAEEINSNTTQDLIKWGRILTDQEDCDALQRLTPQDMRDVADALSESNRYTMIIEH
ncbi:MAG TPA: pitrilysin family protein [Candidatus Paceibacterota bacterium]|jgi:predicted Zn-dependent peptidase|nr:pitrilysin family protein [Candidatus Paceibacterota bacterium]